MTERKVESRTAHGEGVDLVEIRNLSGDIEIIAARGLVAELEVTATYQASAVSRAKAKAALDRITLRIHRDGSRAMILVKHPETKATERYAVSLRILAPADARVDADTGTGTIKVLGMSGAVTARTARGDIEVYNAMGATHLETRRGAVRVSGSLPSFDVKSSRGDVAVTVHERTSLESPSAISASDGKVTLSLNSVFHGQLSAQVRDLVQITPTPGITRQGGTFAGTLGQGGALLSVTAPKGELRLVRRPYHHIRVTPTFQDEASIKRREERKRQMEEGAPKDQPHTEPRRGEGDVRPPPHTHRH